MLCHVIIQEGSREKNNFREQNGPEEFIFWDFREFKIPNLSSSGYLGAAFEIYWLC